MRDIKFRAWDIACSAWVEPPWNLYLNGGVSIDGTWAEVVLEQFTGLLDKNGVEIYENDLFKSEIHKPSNFQVEFIEGAWCATSPHVKEYPTDLNHFYPSTGCEIEVIGNIHPELLEAT